MPLLRQAPLASGSAADGPPAMRPGTRLAGRVRYAPALPIVAWLSIVGSALAVGTVFVARWRDAGLAAAPLDGRWDWRPSLGLLPAVAMGAVVVAIGPACSDRARWRMLLVGSGAGTALWSLVLALSDGISRVSAPLATRHDYLAAVDRIGEPWEFVRTYTERLDQYPVHVKGHPPGLPLVLWVLDRIGFGGAGWAAVLVLAGAALATGSTLVAVRAVAGEATARRAAPFVSLAPAALWFGTSADALFAGVVALACALVVAGQARATHLAGGLVWGVALHLTYGAAPLLAIPAVVAWWRRDARPLVGLALGITTVGVVFLVAGFWWFDGLGATGHFYETGIAAHRPYGVFVLLVNPGALALAIGPAAVVGLWHMRGRTALVPLAALGAVALADLSGLSKGEVERIWLPFVPWLLSATAVLPAARVRTWLAAQLVLAVVLQAALRSPW